MHKKLIISSIAVIQFFSFAVFADSFNDVSYTYKNYSAIEYLKEKGIINGFSDGTFRPEDKINRAEAIKILVEAYSLSSESPYAGQFTDVVSSDWFSQYVISGKEAGIIKGYADGSFKPSNPLTKGEALKIVLSSAKVSVPKTVEKNVFSDVYADDWYAPYAYFARENNIILGDDYGKVYPEADIERGQFAEMIYRTMKISENSGQAFNLSTNWPLYESALGFKMKYNAPRWKTVSDSKAVTFYNPDLAYGDLSASKVFFNSAKISVAVDGNAEQVSSSDYFAKLKSDFPDFQAKEFKYKEMDALELLNSATRQIDWYIYNSTGKVIGAFTQYGAGILAFQYPREISAMLNSIEFSDSTFVSKEQILSDIYKNILIKGKGLSGIKTLPDSTIIETDTIGVGTGAVDYYYCTEYDITFKYERANDLILDKRDGKTTAF